MILPVCLSQGCEPTGTLVRVPGGEGGCFVELKRSNGRKSSRRVLVHQRRLIEEELDPYWDDCCFHYSIVGVHKIAEGKITIEIKSQSTRHSRDIASVPSVVHAFRHSLH